MEKEKGFKEISELMNSYGIDLAEMTEWYKLKADDFLPLEVIYQSDFIGHRSTKIEKLKPLAIVINSDFAISIQVPEDLLDYKSAEKYCNQQKIIGVSGKLPTQEQMIEISRLKNQIRLTLKKLGLKNLDNRPYFFKNDEIPDDVVSSFDIETSRSRTFLKDGAYVNTLPVFNF